jgi:hypothetical protein
VDSGDIDRYIGERCAYGVDWREPTLHAPAHTRISRFYPAQIPFKEANKAMSEICVARYEAFGTAGNASKLRSLDLEEMVKRYDSGELDPTVH